MIGAFQSDLAINVIASIMASAILLAAGFFWGKYRERRKYRPKLEEYDLYPFAVNRENIPPAGHPGDGTTNLLIDLKKRQLLHEKKLNYELNIGSRRFKCTTIPIVRREFGVVGAICINVDVNYLTDEVLKNQERIEAW